MDMDVTTVNVICAMLENRRGLVMSNAKKMVSSAGKKAFDGSIFPLSSSKQGKVERHKK